jgi:ABC-type branched-subunit amino acid transport system substrate-binding protein
VIRNTPNPSAGPSPAGEGIQFIWMRRTGGWLLGLAAVSAIAIGGVLAFRPILFRETVKIASALPRKEPGTGEIVNGIRLALDEHEYRAGRFRVEYVDHDEFPAIAPAPSPSPHDDPSVVAIIGCFDAPHARYVTRTDPTPMLRVAAVSSWSIANNAYARSWTAVTAPLMMQGGAAAGLARRLGCRSAFVVTSSGRDRSGILAEFRARARELGLAVLAEEGFDVERPDATGLVRQVGEKNPDVVFLNSFDFAIAGRVIKQIRSAGFIGRILATEDCKLQEFLDQGGVGVEGTLLLSTLAIPSKEFSQRYRDKFASAPDELAFLGYRACKAALRSIALADTKDREAILHAAQSRASFSDGDGPDKPALGTYVVRGGKFEFMEEVR